MSLTDEQIREFIRELIQNELKEASVTGGIDGGSGPPKTPNAFVKRNNKKHKKAGYDGGHKKPDIFGLKLVKDQKLRGGTEGKTVGKRPQKDLNENKSYSLKFAEWFTGTSLCNVKHPKYGGHQLTQLQIKTAPGNYKNKLFKSIKDAFDRGELDTSHIKKYGMKSDLNEGKYHEYRNNEEFTPKQKIGTAVREIKLQLKELNKVVAMNVRLKSEMDVDTTSLYKRTHKDIVQIEGVLKGIATKLREMI